MIVNWNIIDGNESNTSSQSIRKAIVSVLTRYYPGSIVGSIEKKYNAYKIYLMNGLCLTFDADGRRIYTK